MKVLRPAIDENLVVVGGPRKSYMPAIESVTIVAAVVRKARLDDLDLLVRHRRGMWEAIAEISERDLHAADSVYRRWARTRMRSGRLVGFIVEESGEPVASGCIWLMSVQPRPNWKGTTVAYLLSMFTEPGHRGKGHARRIVRAAIQWSKSRGFSVMLLHSSPYGRPIYEAEGFAPTTEMRLSLKRRASTRRPRRRRRTPAR